MYLTGDRCWHGLCALRHDLKIHDKSHKYFLSAIEYYLKKYEISKFEFKDFCNVNIDELDKLCCFIARKKLNIKWAAPALIDKRMKCDFIERMKRAGCEKVIIELFSAADDLLNKIGAVFNAMDAYNALRMYKDAKIDVGVNLVFGHPLERQSDRDATINFLRDNTDLIGEIASVTFCTERLVDLCPSCSPCYYRKNCLKTTEGDSLSVFAPNFTNLLSKLNSLKIPVACVYPAKSVFDEFEESVLKNKDLRFYFNKGKGDIFFKAQKITSGLGLYTSIFVNNSWHDSAHADWKIDKINSKKIILTGKWHLLPIIQHWEIGLYEKNAIRVRIDIEFLQEMLIEGEQQINIMLKNEYNKWSSSSGVNGLMPVLFNDGWPTLFEDANKNTDMLQIESDIDNLPLVSLTSKKQDQDYYMAVLNTSTVFNARVLKSYKIGSKSCLPCKYAYFDGEIQVESRT